MKILVSGCAGFLGRHVWAALEGRERLGVDKEAKADGTALVAKLEWMDPVHLEKVDIVIHCAASPDIKDNWSLDGGTLDAQHSDEDATKYLLSILPATLKRFVYCSSASVYGSSASVYGPSSAPRHETDPLVAQSPYAASKLSCEAWIQAYATKYGWAWSAVRFPALFGPGYKRGHVADFVRQVNETGAIRALDVGHPKAALHVKDAAELLVLLATKEPAPVGIFNARGNEAWSWRDTARVMGAPVEAFEARDGGFVGDNVGLQLDDSRARLLGWAPQRTVGAGVRDALESLGWTFESGDKRIASGTTRVAP